jgi:PAS domain S-box-containing protein
LHYILGKEKVATTSGMGAAQGIVHHSSDGIILANAMCMTDYVNPSVTHILGYSPEQLLGQQMTMIFEEAKRRSIEAQIQLMRNGQSNSVYEDEVNCKANDNSLVPCMVIILALSGGGGRVDDLVLIIKDNSVVQEQRWKAERAKAQSEQLLYAILPRGIVSRINSGEKDVTFSVPVASVMFIDIVKFSEYSFYLTPQQIMGTLSSIFGSFDNKLSRAKSLTKIKLIGDVYMCAAGLFDQFDQAKSAEEIVIFALDCLGIIEDLNIKRNTDLSVRIGVNTGGPIIAGVLGTDNRIFDIIGDAINVAARLQSTSLPNTIQMSQATYDCIAHCGFPVRRRDKVFLKGKGEVSTYMLNGDESMCYERDQF